MNFLQVLKPCDVACQARKGETPKVLTLRTAHRAGDARNSGKALCSKCFSIVETTKKIESSFFQKHLSAQLLRG